MDREVDVHYDHLTIHPIMYGQGGGCSLMTILPYTPIMYGQGGGCRTILPYTPIMYGQGGDYYDHLTIHSYYVWTGRWM